MTNAVQEYSDVQAKYTWNAESVFPTREAWREAFQREMSQVDSLARWKGQLGESPATLLDYFEATEAALKRVGHIYFYATMSQAVNSNDSEAVSMSGQAGGLFAKFIAATSYGEPELLTIGQETLKTWAAQEPGLAVYAHYFDTLFRRQEHVRSADVEEVLGLAAEPFQMIQDTYDLLTNSDLHFEPAINSNGEQVPITQGTIGKLLDSGDRELRRTAWEHYADSHLSMKNTLASTLLTSVKRDVFVARARRYNSALEASLFPDNVPLEVFHNLIDTYKKHLPTWHRYWAIRRKALGVETLQPYDIWAPLTNRSPELSYEQAVDWIAEGMKPLGSDYVDMLRRGCLDDRWVDVYPTPGKRQGAFSFGWPGTYPFIMMSFNDDLSGLSTLAHELGHSMHSYLTWKHQPMAYSQYSLFVAEVASNFNQAMVRASLFETNPDPAFQISLIGEAMDNFHRYFFIMPTLARFELEIHERIERGEGVTADDMINLMADLFAEGYGGEIEVNRDRVGITWAEFGHLYASYYVFQYATGISAAHALAAPILRGKPGAAERYIEFLSAGSSLYPTDALKRAGIDLTTPAAVETAFGVLADYVDRLAKLTGVE